MHVNNENIVLYHCDKYESSNEEIINFVMMNNDKDTITFQLIEDEEFMVSTDMADFPISDCPHYLRVVIGAVCISGSAVIQIFDKECHIKPEMVVTLIPWQFVSIKEVSTDFKILFYRASLEMFTDSLSSLWRLTPEFFSYMRNHIASKPMEGNILRFMHFCDLLSYWNEHAPKPCRRESVMQLLRVHLWNVYAIYICDPNVKKVKYSRKEEVAFKFMRMIIEDHSPEMDVAYYAEKLNLSPKSLTNLIRSISGHSARDWIVYFLILEIKALLRQSSIDLKSIISYMDFPDQSSLSRFFRRYTGLTPSQYRKSIHF